MKLFGVINSVVSSREVVQTRMLNAFDSRLALPLRGVLGLLGQPRPRTLLFQQDVLGTRLIRMLS